MLNFRKWGLKPSLKSTSFNGRYLILDKGGFLGNFEFEGKKRNADDAHHRIVRRCFP